MAKLALVPCLAVWLTGATTIAVPSDLRTVVDQIPPLTGGMSDFLGACDLRSSETKSVRCDREELTIFASGAVQLNHVRDNAEIKPIARALFSKLSEKVPNVEPNRIDELILCERLKTRSGLCSLVFFSDREEKNQSRATIYISPRDDENVFDVSVLVYARRP